jgi:cellobiose-specific phosphotransferase system component IIC
MRCHLSAPDGVATMVPLVLFGTFAVAVAGLPQQISNNNVQDGSPRTVGVTKGARTTYATLGLLCMFALAFMTGKP